MIDPEVLRAAEIPREERLLRLLRQNDHDTGVAILTVAFAEYGEELVRRERDNICRARRTADPPQDCDWPFCGCDPAATRVLESLVESGHLTRSPR